MDNATSPLSKKDTDPPMREIVRLWWTVRHAYPGARWKYWLVTITFNCFFALFLTLMFYAFRPGKIDSIDTLLETLLISNCIGCTIHGLMELIGKFRPNALSNMSSGKRSLVIFLIMLVGVFIGYMIAFAFMGRNFAALIAAYPRFGFGTLLIGFLGCLLMLFINQAQTLRMQAEIEDAKAHATEIELRGQADQANLRALQAQIEPHFLFNTLANVQALIDYEPQKAKQMLDAFINHLRLSLSDSRAATTTLSNEIALIESYLTILQIRLGARLAYSISIAPALANLPIAPLMLQPLVENAVKYGLEPNANGGSVAITARREGDDIVIEVADDGVGLGTPSTARKGTGLGLTNVRARLQSQYGDKATLTVTPRNAPETGTISTLRFPYP